MLSDDDLYEEFCVEIIELVEGIEDALMQVEKNLNLWPQKENDVLRDLHSIKGACGMFGILEIEKCIHAIETEYKNSGMSNSLVNQILNITPLILDRLNNENLGEQYPNLIKEYSFKSKSYKYIN